MAELCKETDGPADTSCEPAVLVTDLGLRNVLPAARITSFIPGTTQGGGDQH